MTETATVLRASPASLPPGALEAEKVRSTDLLRGSRELLIQHHGDTYRLRLTSNDKLILTK